ncbi:hypothetical protein [Tritonibacter mobilis]
MSSAFRHTACARHPALNRLPRDFLSAGSLPSLTTETALQE